MAAVVSAMALVSAVLVPLLRTPAAGAAVTQLRRYPYLTDLVGTSVTVNWATDRSGASASAMWGAVSNTGGCVPNHIVSAARTSITVNGVGEYQWASVLSLPARGTYCYRVFLGTTDLLGADASPEFTTQIPQGSTEPFSFAVFGDWGLVDANGANADQANLMTQIAASGVNFAVTVGDNGYPSGSQTNYGDLQQLGSGISAIFGPSFWAVPGRSIPLFTSSGNHGISATTNSASTEQINWPESVAVATSGGRYLRETYCCVNGTNSASYPSSWYAFDAGNARFYVLQADWADSNVGTGTVYSDDFAAHWTQNSPEYRWLAADLEAHPSGLKFAFFHYPLYSDQKAQTSDSYLQGSSSLEGLLASAHVSIAFNGHAHVYERNAPTAPGSFPSYVTGGGGATLQPVGEAGCSAFDAYAIGWSPSKLKGSRCGTAPVPDSAARVFHFLKVTVNGPSVTVAPTDELGRTFDVQTYSFNSLPDTIVDSGPAPATNSTSAAFTFHSTASGASYACALDGATLAPCTSPTAYAGLAEGSHTFTVRSAASGGADPSPATYSWTIDLQPPTRPGGLVATAASSGLVNLTWNASSDTNGVSGYDITRNGTLLATVPGTTTSYADTAVTANATYSYSVTARDAAGNTSTRSDLATVVTPGAGSVVFADGFESGNLAAWTSSAGLTIQAALRHSGSYAAQALTTNGTTYAKKTLPSTYVDGYARIWFDLESASSQVNLLRFRTTGDTSVAYLFVTATGQLGLRNAVTDTTVTSSTSVSQNGWHELELHTRINGASSRTDVWLDGVHIDPLSITTDLGTNPIGRLQIGEVQSGRTYNVVYDDVAFGTQRVGP